MKPIKKLNDTIQYADLYRKLKSYAEERRGFNYGGLATGELNMEDDPDNSYSFSEQLVHQFPSSLYQKNQLILRVH